jgi:hypothetical protein
MVGRLVMYAALLVALGIVVVSACAPQQAGPSPTAPPASPSVSRTAAASPTAARTATAVPTTTRPSPLPTATPAASPGSTPATACPRSTGGETANQAQLVAVRIAHQPGFDRLVFEFGQSTAPGPFGLPAYAIEPTNSLSGPSGQPVAIIGNAIFGARFMNTSTQTPTGVPSYTGSTDLRPTTPLIRQVRLVEDFERVMVWGIGLDHPVCPRVLVLSSPMRVVVDFPTPP